MLAHLLVAAKLETTFMSQNGLSEIAAVRLSPSTNELLRKMVITAVYTITHVVFAVGSNEMDCSIRITSEAASVSRQPHQKSRVFPGFWHLTLLNTTRRKTSVSARTLDTRRATGRLGPSIGERGFPTSWRLRPVSKRSLLALLRHC